jgi:hypothetical protein
MAKNTKYVSDATKFLNGVLQKTPELQEKRMQLRSTWWDRSTDEIDTDAKLNENNLKHPPYSYY